jgi:hypothetical protein
MADENQIAELRLLVGEPDDSNGWTDEQLAAAIDVTGTLEGAAARVWSSKAATFSQLVDVSESGSSRKLSDLHKNALTMAERYRNQAQASVVTGPVIHRIRRGFS